MGRSIIIGSSGIAALAAALAFAGPAHASASPNAVAEVAQRDAIPAASPAPAPESFAAQVTISRAGEQVGQPVFFSRSSAAGGAGLVAFSTRRTPAGAVFSIALQPPRPLFTPSLGTRFGGVMPSIMPVSARALTSGFGWRQHPILGTLRVHSGVDLAAGYGAPIVATSDGVVNTADWAGGYGLLVALDHGGGLQTRYGHMSRLAVSAGQQVRKGEVIGYVGSTGRSTGPHLHYEIRVNGQAVNPAGHLHGR